MRSSTRKLLPTQDNTKSLAKCEQPDKEFQDKSSTCPSETRISCISFSVSARFARIYDNFISIPAIQKNSFYLLVFAIRGCCIFHFNRNKPSLGGMFWRLLLFLAHFVTHHFGEVFYVFFLCRLKGFWKEINFGRIGRIFLILPNVLVEYSGQARLCKQAEAAIFYIFHSKPCFRDFCVRDSGGEGGGANILQWQLKNLPQDSTPAWDGLFCAVY